MPEIKKPKSTDEILREMEEMSKGVSDADSKAQAPHKSESGGVMKSLMGFFIKVHEEDEHTQAANPSPAAASKGQPTARGAQPGMPNMPSAPPRKVQDLVADEPAPKFAPPKKGQTADLSVKPFEEIYVEAGFGKTATPVDDLIALMESPTVANQPFSVKVVAVSLALSAKGTKVEDYIADAVRKDRALDGYQKMLTDRSIDVETKTKADIERIQKEVEEYLKRKQIEIENLRAQASETSRQTIEFAVRRQVEEQRLAAAISPFLEGKPNPVTVGNTPEEPPKS